MQTGVVVLKKAGVDQLPEAFLTKVLETHDKAYGIAIVAGDNIVTQSEGTKFSYAEVLPDEANQNFYKENTVLHFFGGSDNGFDIEEIPPFPVVVTGEGEDANTRVAVLMEGDFTPFIREKEKKGAAYNAAMDYIIPKIKAIWDAGDETLETFWPRLDNKILAIEIMNTTVTRGIIALLGSNGEVKIWAKASDDHKELSFGWTSNACGYVEGDFPAKSDAAPAKKGLLGRMSKAKPADPVPDPKPVAGPKLVTAPPAGDTAPVKPTEISDNAKSLGFTMLNGELHYQCPAGITEKSQIKNLYHLHAGFCPGNFEKRPRVRCNKEAENKFWQKYTSGQYKPFSTDTAGKKTPDGVHTIKDTSTKIIPLKEKEETQKMHKLILDSVGEEISDPRMLYKTEAKVTTYADIVGEKDIGCVLWYGKDGFDWLIKDHPELASKVMCEMAAWILDSSEEVTDGEAEEAGQRKAM